MKIGLASYLVLVAFLPVRALPQDPSQPAETTPVPEDSLYRGRDAESALTQPARRSVVDRLRGRVKKAAGASTPTRGSAIDIVDGAGPPPLVPPRDTPVDM